MILEIFNRAGKTKKKKTFNVRNQDAMKMKHCTVDEKK